MIRVAVEVRHFQRVARFSAKLGLRRFSKFPIPHALRGTDDYQYQFRSSSISQLPYVMSQSILNIAWLVKAAVHQLLDALLSHRSSQRTEKSAPFR
jgi:hypothetical protein